MRLTSHHTTLQKSTSRLTKEISGRRGIEPAAPCLAAGSSSQRAWLCFRFPFQMRTLQRRRQQQPFGAVAALITHIPWGGWDER